ncbi:UNVERIFIED_CONTAM: hypothetical protein FKN15_041275 [Acipenser sinensis]
MSDPPSFLQWQGPQTFKARECWQGTWTLQQEQRWWHLWWRRVGTEAHLPLVAEAETTATLATVVPAPPVATAPATPASAVVAVAILVASEVGLAPPAITVGCASTELLLAACARAAEGCQPSPLPVLWSVAPPLLALGSVAPPLLALGMAAPPPLALRTAAAGEAAGIYYYNQ